MSGGGATTTFICYSVYLSSEFDVELAPRLATKLPKVLSPMHTGSVLFICLVAAPGENCARFGQDFFATYWELFGAFCLASASDGLRVPFDGQVYFMPRSSQSHLPFLFSRVEPASSWAWTRRDIAVHSQFTVEMVSGASQRQLNFLQGVLSIPHCLYIVWHIATKTGMLSGLRAQGQDRWAHYNSDSS